MFPIIGDDWVKGNVTHFCELGDESQHRGDWLKAADHFGEAAARCMFLHKKDDELQLGCKGKETYALRRFIDRQESRLQMARDKYVALAIISVVGLIIEAGVIAFLFGRLIAKW